MSRPVNVTFRNLTPKFNSVGEVIDAEFTHVVVEGTMAMAWREFLEMTPLLLHVAIKKAALEQCRALAAEAVGVRPSSALTV